MVNAPINDLIFKEIIKRGYSLEGRTRVWNIADSKLWYLTPKQAQAYLELEKLKSYSHQMFDVEIEMLKKYMAEISERILHGGSLNIIDIGCGDGKKAVVPVDFLHKKTKIRYCPIDISGYMVSKAIEKMSKLNKGEVVNFKWNISDFDNLENVASFLRDHEYKQNFLMFLGSTISNFEIHEVMYEVAEAMNKGIDYLLMGVALSHKNPREIVNSYASKSVDDFLSLVLTQVGFKRDEIKFGSRYENSRVELFYTLKKDKQLSLGDKAIHFDKGDQILVAVSYRYTLDELEKALKIYFDKCKFYFDKDKSWALILCEK